MKLSSGDRGSELGSVPQHRPQDVDAAARQGDYGLLVPLALGSLTIVEGPGGGRGA
jgi:hypothetical protein